MASLNTEFAGLSLDCCVYNASGPRTGSKNMLVTIGKSMSGAVVSKSATLVGQTGNDFPRYYETGLGDCCAGSLNSEGLPNKGVDYYIEDDLVAAVNECKKPYIVSLSGLSLKDNLEMLDRVSKADGIAAIELNLACPNIPGKPTVAYDFDQMDNILKEVCAHPGFSKQPLGVKLAPYFDMPHYAKAAEIINKYPIKFVTCVNTMGNALMVDAESEEAIIAPKGGFGGLAGGFIKHIALANVRQMSQRLRDDIDVIGVGGVSNGKDAFELILCGAKAVQIGTKHYKEGAAVFDRVAMELKELMDRKGYKSIEDFR
jgi:dihydroorotate dehydrogenase (fumarate)